MKGARVTACLGGKKISLIVSDQSLLNKHVAYLQDLYDKISFEYGNKLDRESVFFFIVLKIMNEKEDDFSVLCDKVNLLINDIDSI